MDEAYPYARYPHIYPSVGYRVVYFGYVLYEPYFR